MIEPESFIANSPYSQTHGNSLDKFNITNTTSELLKFQLQEQHRTSLAKAQNLDKEESDILNYGTNIFHNSFNGHLQERIECGSISIHSLSSLSSSGTPSNGDELVYNEDEREEEKEEKQEALEAVLQRQSKNPNYLNLKILMENSIFDASLIGKNAIMPLHNLEQVKSTISDKTDLQHYLLSKIFLTSQFINQVTNEDSDLSVLSRAVKIMQSLSQQAMQNNKELDALKQKLNEHNMSCLLLGYIDDVKRNQTMDPQELLMGGNGSNGIDIGMGNGSGAPPSITTGSPTRMQASSALPSPMKANQSHVKIFDSLFSYIASVAAQRGVSLPSPEANLESVQMKIEWLQQCLDKLLESSPASSTYTTSGETNTTKKDGIFDEGSSLPVQTKTALKALSEYKTALTDLRFSYQYLAKEYELSRATSSKTIQEYRKKLEKLKNETNFGTESNSVSFSSNRRYTSSSMLSSASIDDKDKEISKLRKELNLLKVDSFGSQQNNLKVKSPSQNDFTKNVSPVTGWSLGVSPTESENGTVSENNGDVTIATSPTSTQQTPQSSGVSNALLKKEFKKIISEMQDQYELELTEERLKRKKLEDELSRLRDVT
ncbi:PEA2 [Candida oxycetoniae]|uniref:PEA2 n=1 Tax=Candida oxycetoniae TaxID=497107 RepID=A0AAI9SV51_9ASCO|nr:PEA2 [Candida oxycetoniae]KAI3403651.2 PEA2 [Candida oxycetoniae]